MATKLNLNVTDGKEFDVTCQRCLGATSHKVGASVSVSGDDGHIDWNTDYQILQCMGCKTISFRSSSTNSEDYFYDENNEPQNDETVKLFPPRLAGFSGLGDDAWHLPDKIRRIYIETSQALVGGSEPVLTGIGVRAILETICKDQNASGQNLFTQIDDLVRKNILTPVRALVLHQIRTLGNQAAHEVAPHSLEQLALAMTVVDHLLQEVYVLPAKTALIFPRAPVAPILAQAVAPPLLGDVI